MIAAMSVFVQKVALDFGETHLRLYLADSQEFTQESHSDLYLRFQASQFLLRGARQKKRSFSSIYSRGKILDEAKFAAYLQYVLANAGLGRFVLTRIELLISVSSQLSAATKIIWSTVCERIGISKVTFVHTPVAGAVGAGFDFPIPTVAMIVHLGDSESSVSVVSLSHCLFSSPLSFAGKILREKVRAARCIHTQETLSESDWESMRDRVGDMLSAIEGPKEEHYFTRLVQECSQGMVADIQAALEKLSIEELSLCTTQGIVLTGGFASQLGIAQFLSRQLGIPVYAAHEPALAVIHGQATLLRFLEQEGNE